MMPGLGMRWAGGGVGAPPFPITLRKYLETRGLEVVLNLPGIALKFPLGQVHRPIPLSSPPRFMAN